MDASWRPSRCARLSRPRLREVNLTLRDSIFAGPLAVGDDFFFARDSSRNILAGSCGRGTPQGVLANSTDAERLAACTDMLN